VSITVWGAVRKSRAFFVALPLHGKRRGAWHCLVEYTALAFFVYEITTDEAGNGNTKQNYRQKNLHTHFNLQTSF
jgi:hypothetical protein